MVYGPGRTGTTLRKIARAKKRDPFRVLVATILSQRTRDENTDRASRQLFARFSSASALAHAPSRVVEHLIRPSGFYRVKARRIKQVARIISSRYGGKVPKDPDALMELPMVGRKTANCVLVYGFGKPAIPVDTHVHRISNRLGIVKSTAPEQTEEKLLQYFERRSWIEVNELMVRFGKTICRPVKPRCYECSLRSYCSYSAKQRHPSRANH